MKKTLIGITIGLALGFSLSTVASGTWETIDVLRNDIKVVVKGSEITADNFLYKDTTYLPLRAISEALGLDVQYNKETNMAIVVERTDEMDKNPDQGTTVTSAYEVPVYTDGFAGNLGYPYVAEWDIYEYAKSIGVSRTATLINDAKDTRTLIQYYNDELGVPKSRILLDNIPCYGSAIRYDYWINTLKPFLDNLAAQRNQE